MSKDSWYYRCIETPLPIQLVKELKESGFQPKSADPNLGEALDWLWEKYQARVVVTLDDRTVEPETWFARIQSEHPKMKNFEFKNISPSQPYAKAIIEALKDVHVLHWIIDLEEYYFPDI